MSSRLPTTAVPSHYSLSYHSLNLLSPPYQFFGSVKISLAISPKQSELTFHCLDLNISAAKVSGGAFPLAAEKISYDVANQSCTLTFGEELPAETTLELSFEGRLNDQMHGLYRSSYTSPAGETRLMATTQFEATDARRAFPCWDEPAFKATFELSAAVPLIGGREMAAVSNTPVASARTSAGGLDRVYEFERTPRMSTYLLALVVGEFDCIATTSAKTKIRTTVYTMPGKAPKAAFCLSTATAALDFFNDFYEVPYPLPKSDLLAIPDFAAGAMENWGCVTYREAKILIDAGTSLQMRKGIARTVCHELAHMWFGNLATMEWWDGLFLNEVG